MFDFSIPQSQSVLPVDLHEQISFGKNAFSDVTVANDDMQFPPPKKTAVTRFDLQGAFLDTVEDAQFPPPKK